MINTNNVVAVILGGGQGSRLEPLTRDRAKPAVPFAGRYRLVDIPMSNCINNDIRKIFLLTQFNSVSLHQHVQSTYHFDQFHHNFVRILAAQQTPDSRVWFQGTADAVRQTLRYILEQRPEVVLILSGDQLYRMDFKKLIAYHLDRKADVSISTIPVERADARSLGIMQINTDKRVVKFVEKPKQDSQLDELKAPMYPNERFLANMGIYVFKPEILKALLEECLEGDFGKNIIPYAIGIGKYAVYSDIFEGYWKDIGTVRSFWETNLDLTEVVPPFTLYDTRARIYTRMRYLPPSKINCCDLNHCLLSEGCIISGHRILHAIIGIRALVGEGSVIEHSVVMGADYYEEGSPPSGLPPIGVGKDCYIKNAIIDKNARIGNGAYITPDGKADGTVTELYTVKEGIIVIPKNAVIQPGMKV